MSSMSTSDKESPKSEVSSDDLADMLNEWSEESKPSHSTLENSVLSVDSASSFEIALQDINSYNEESVGYEESKGEAAASTGEVLHEETSQMSLIPDSESSFTLLMHDLEASKSSHDDTMDERSLSPSRHLQGHATSDEVMHDGLIPVFSLRKSYEEWGTSRDIQAMTGRLK